MAAFLREWKNDFAAGVVVFLVAVPLCLGIALASGAPLFSGIIAGFVGGLVVTLVSNSSLGVSGPAAGLVAIVLAAINDLGFEVFLMAVVLAGLIQIGLGLLRCGIIGYSVPTAVIKGMLAAIGLIIILKQIPHAFGDDRVYEGDLAFQQADGHNTFSEITSAFSFTSPGAIVICGVCLALIVLWEKQLQRRFPICRIIQGSLVAILLGIGLQLAFAGSETFALRPDQLVNLPIASSWAEFFGQFRTPALSALAIPAVYITALTLAIVASLESLLCAEATDKLDPQKRTTNLNRELVAQGVGNMVSGAIGGLPITQVVLRSSVNIQGGGKTRAAAFFHGLVMLACVALIPGLLNKIPLASLAAVLLVVGYKLAHPSVFRKMYKLGWDQFLPFICTVAAILLTDLLIGILIGLGMSILFILKQHYRQSYWLHDRHTENGKQVVLVLAENVSFLNKASILKTLRGIPRGSRVTIDGRMSMHIDQDIRDMLEEFSQGARHQGIDIELLLGKVQDQTIAHHKLKVLDQVPSDRVCA